MRTIGASTPAISRPKMDDIVINGHEHTLRRRESKPDKDTPSSKILDKNSPKKRFSMLRVSKLENPARFFAIGRSSSTDGGPDCLCSTAGFARKRVRR